MAVNFYNTRSGANTRSGLNTRSHLNTRMGFTDDEFYTDAYHSPYLADALITSREGVIGHAEDPLPFDHDGRFGANGDVFRWAGEVRRTLFVGELAHDAKFVDGVVDGQPRATLQINGQTVSLTRPTEQELNASTEIGMVLGNAKLRREREAEIHVQTSDLLPFFGSVVNLNAERQKYTVELLNVVLDATVFCHMPLKHRLAVRRPSEIEPRVQPMLPVPGHGSYPSGHATEARTLALVLIELLQAAWKLPSHNANFQRWSQQITRHAERIAHNRVIAGVHYPCDSIAGFQVADALAPAFVSRFRAQGSILNQLWGKAIREWEHLGSLPAAPPGPASAPTPASEADPGE
ncbi:MAG: phosphatase PAP2 family protein [Rhodobacter sp.]|nr:phosphatase PAP2 family protein [Rhodobacter sp.]